MLSSVATFWFQFALYENAGAELLTFTYWTVLKVLSLWFTEVIYFP